MTNIEPVGIEQFLWKAILYPQGAPAPQHITVQQMPPDGSCFYHALYRALTHLPEAKAQMVNDLFNTYNAQLLKYVANIDRTTTELDIPQPADINYIHTIRFMIAMNVNDADFESYQMLCVPGHGVHP